MKKIIAFLSFVIGFAILLTGCDQVSTSQQSLLRVDSDANDPIVPEAVISDMEVPDGGISVEVGAYVISNGLVFNPPKDVPYFTEANYAELEDVLIKDAVETISITAKAFFGEDFNSFFKSIELGDIEVIKASVLNPDAAFITEDTVLHEDIPMEIDILTIKIPYTFRAAHPGSDADDDGNRINDMQIIVEFGGLLEDGDPAVQYRQLYAKSAREDLVHEAFENLNLKDAAFVYQPDHSDVDSLSCIYTSNGEIFYTGDFWTEEQGWRSHEDTYEYEYVDTSSTYDHAVMGWPTTANETWDRYYNSGGSFFIDRENDWCCNIYGVALVWSGDKWRYLGEDYNIYNQFQNTDYFSLDTSGGIGYYNAPRWKQLVPQGMTNCAEPQVFNEYANALEKSVYETNLKSCISTWEKMGFTCYQEEDEIWVCDTGDGILKYDSESQRWRGTVDVYHFQTQDWEYDVDIESGGIYNYMFAYADGRYDDVWYTNDRYVIANYGYNPSYFGSDSYAAYPIDHGFVD